MNIIDHAFISSHTDLTCPSDCPEIKLHLATEITPMWMATENFLEKNALPPPFWAFAWAGGQALARFVLDHPERVRGKRVLDFAAGSGLVAIAAAKAGAAEVWTAEIDPIANIAIRLNAEANGVDLGIISENVLEKNETPWDVVLAGDVCYEKPMAELVLAFLLRCKASGAAVFMGDPGRAYLPQSGMNAKAHYTIACTLELEDRTSRDVTIYQF